MMLTSIVVRAVGIEACLRRPGRGRRSVRHGCDAFSPYRLQNFGGVKGQIKWAAWSQGISMLWERSGGERAV